MTGGNRVEDDVEAVAVRLHLAVVARYHHFIRAQIQRRLALVFRMGEGDHVRAHRMGNLHAHVAETTDADHANLLARADVPVTQRRIGGDAGAQQRRHRRKLVFGVANLQHEILVNHDALRVTTQGVSWRVPGLAVVGADEALLAILLKPFVAGGAMLAAVDHGNPRRRFRRP